jgi:hypothetical protein
LKNKTEAEEKTARKRLKRYFDKDTVVYFKFVLIDCGESKRQKRKNKAKSAKTEKDECANGSSNDGEEVEVDLYELVAGKTCDRESKPDESQAVVEHEPKDPDRQTVN